MIYWSTKYDLQGECKGILPEECKICSDKNMHLYKKERAYFLLYGLALMPMSSSLYKICSSCNTKLKLQSSDKQLQYVHDTIPFKNKVKYYWGWIIILVIAAFILWILNIYK